MIFIIFVDMALLQIPDEVWRCIVCDWVHVPAAIRFDAAISSSYTSLSMRLIYSNNDFAGTYIVHPRHMQRLAKWLRSRNAILRQVCVTDVAYGVNSVEWRQFFLTTQGKFRSLHIDSYTDVLYWASDYCMNLSELSVAGCGSAGMSISRIIQCSASTLQSLKFAHPSSLTEIPILRVASLRWDSFHNFYLQEFLRLCPHLTSLSVSTAGTLVPSGIAETCSKLHTLELGHVTLSNADSLTSIGNACSSLTRLHLWQCRLEFNFRDAAESLPQLQTLTCDTWSDKVSGARGAGVSTALRVLDLGNSDVSVNGVRSIASVYRHLTSLCVGKLFDRGQAATLAHSTLEYCTQLRYLEMGGNKHAVTTMLQSAAVHCLQLRTLYIRFGLVNNAEILHNLANYCVNLHTITVPSYMYRHVVQTLQPKIQICILLAIILM